MPKRIAQRLGRVALLGETAELCFEPALQGLRYVKDPATGRRVSRINPRENLPERVIDDAKLRL